MNDDKLSVLFHTATGVFGGYLSSLFTSNLYAVAVAFVVLFVSGKVNELLVEKRGLKWWIANGAGIYILVWLMTWVLFFNL